MATIVRNIQNNDLYEYIGEKFFRIRAYQFRNMRTGKTGLVSGDVARKIFKINLQATQMVSEYPLVAEMISTLNLKIKHDDTEKKSRDIEQSVPGTNAGDAKRALAKNP